MICQALERVQERVLKACERSGRKREEILLVGATKSVKPEIVRAFFECGLKSFGENRVQEFLEKYQALEDLSVDWHFIGTLQSNKVKYIWDKVSLIHSLDRESTATEIEKRAKHPVRILVQVNVGNEETKGGVRQEHLKSFVERLLNYKNIVLEGLMCIPPYFQDPQKTRPYFGTLRNLKEDLEREFNLSLPHLSMGMSDDFEVAIEEGATIVRVGRALFGERGYGR